MSAEHPTQQHDQPSQDAQQKVEETKAQLQHKLDETRAQAQQKAGETKAQAQDTAGQAQRRLRSNLQPVAIAGAVALGLLVALVVRKRS